MKKVIVLGCSGSGKSVFARRLQERTGLPLICLDNLWWKPDRSHISRDEFDAVLAEVLRTDAWIIDGDYSRTYETRIRACDTVFFLDYGEEVCMAGIRERVGKVRPDMPWVENRLDPELVELVQNYRRDNRPVVLELLERYSDREIHTFRSREEAERWLLQPTLQQ